MDYFKIFCDEVLIPTIKQHNITEVIHLGDIVDNRKHINFYTSNRLRNDFIEPILNLGVNFHLIIGNHDQHFRNDNDVSIASELFPYYNQLNFPGKLYWYKDPTEVLFDNKPILFVPWVCDSNREQTYELISKTNSQIVFGHLELKGFEMFKGVVQNHGEDPNIYSKFDIVATGHYHHKSSSGNIHYVGSSSQFTWADYGDERGFHLFDINTHTLEFVRNPYDLFVKIFYNDSEEVKTLDYSILTNKFVKVIVSSKNNSILYDWFLNKIEDSRPIEYKVVDDHFNLDKMSDEVVISEVKDTLTIMLDYVKQINNYSNSEKLTLMLSDLYREALSIEN